jgi:hypothetical protein
MLSVLPKAHRVLRWVLALAAGVFLALYSFERITDPEPRMQRAREEAAVLKAREILQGFVAGAHAIDLVDPLQTNRKVGKVYIYPSASGWELSGHYRRDAGDVWHAYLMRLDPQLRLVSLSVRDGDARLAGLSAEDPRFSAVP